MPHLENCPHCGDGWCLDCVSGMHDQIETLRAWIRTTKDEDGNTLEFLAKSSIEWHDAGLSPLYPKGSYETDKRRIAALGVS